MRKIISIFMTAVLLCSFAFSAFAEDVVPVQDTLRFDSTGITLALTDAMKNAKGMVQGMDGGEAGTGSGIYNSSVIYVAVTSDSIDALFKTGFSGFMLHDQL